MSGTGPRGRFRGIQHFSDVESVLSQILPQLRVESEWMKLRTRLAVGRVLAADVYAPRDLPPFHMSHMDGFAVRSADLAGASERAPVSLVVEGSIGPGEHGRRLTPGSSFRIHTGGYLPEGSDSVVPQEDVSTDGKKIYVTRPYEPLENVVPAGSDVMRGQLVASRGEILTPVKASLLEALGVYWVDVRLPPRVSILSFGDELTDNPEEVGRGKILNTHAVVVSGMARALGCEVVRASIFRDRSEDVAEAIGGSLADSNCILTIGGSSVGDIDLVASELRRRSQIFIQGLKLHPGRVGGVALVQGRPVIMLPGLIHSTINVFNYLAAPILALMQGMNLSQLMLEVEAYMAEQVSFHRWIDFRKIVWVTLKREAGAKYLAYPNMADASNISSIARSHGFVEAAPNKTHLDSGEVVSVKIPLWVTRSINLAS